jgi:hypothetical protein
MVTGPVSHFPNMEYFEILGAATGVALLADLLVAYARPMFNDSRGKDRAKSRRTAKRL